jgi:asparagine synthase (glutamine-hydrolysing)
MLPPGHCGFWQNGTFFHRSYWSLAKASQESPDQPYEETCREVRELLGQAVERRMISDVALGAFLSGGIDSSAIVALMAQSSTQKVNTFSVVFDEKAYDESKYANMIARKYATEHHPIKLKPEDFLKDLPEALASLDHPSGDGLNSYVVSKVTRQKGFTVALSGLGGDELFAGYPVFKRYEKLKQLPFFYGFPHTMRSALGKTIATVYQNHKTERLRELISLPNRNFDELYPIFRKRFDDDEILALVGDPVSPARQLRALFTAEELTAINQLPFFSQVSVGEIQTYTQNVLLRDTDQMSMASSLEVRVPFFDHELVSYTLGIPDKHKNPVYPKKLLVDALGELLPKEIVHRPKMGFMFPWEQWIRQDLKDFCAKKIATLAERNIFNSDALHSLWDRFLKKDPRVTWIKVWMLVALEDWLERIGQ